MLKKPQNLMMKNKNNFMIRYTENLQNHKKVNSYLINIKKDLVSIKCQKLR
jgi:hypothetical protein